jgi:hypothetical protein
MENTKSGVFLANRELPPIVSPNMYKSVSDFRREGLEQQVLEGKFRESASGNSFVNAITRTGASNVVGARPLNKTAQLFNSSSGTSSGAGWRGQGGTVRQAGEIYSPLWLNSNLSLPRDRATINAWCRSFFALNPIVQNAISLHSTYPIAKLNIKCKDARARLFFEQMAEEVDLMNVCTQIAQEYWTLGEAFPYAELDVSSGKWSRILLQNPDYIDVRRSVMAGEPVISLRPDENLRRICTSNKPSDVQQRQQLERNIIEHVKRGENIPLSNFYVSHLPRRISPYEVRGTSIIVSIFRSLMLYDKIIECKFVQADSLINPITIVKVGGGVDNYKPTPADLEFWRDIFEAAENDKNFKIITHDGVSVERVGAGQGIYDTSNDVTQCIKNMYIGLMVPSVIMDGGGDVTYANGGVTLDVLRQRYMYFRNMLTAWLRRKIFAPIAKLNDFYEYKDRQKVLIVPEIEWNHMSLFDMGDYIQSLTTLATAERKQVSTQTLYKSLGLEYEDEVRKIRREYIDQAILAKEQESLSRTSLNELRAMNDEDEIKEVQQEPLPGQVANEPGGMGGGMPGGLPGEIGGAPPGGLGGSFGPPPGPPPGMGGAPPGEPPKKP